MKFKIEKVFSWKKDDILISFLPMIVFSYEKIGKEKEYTIGLMWFIFSIAFILTIESKK